MALIKQVINGNFSNPATWETGTVPVTGDSIVSYDGLSLTIDTDCELGSSAASGGWPNSFDAPFDGAPSAAIWVRRGNLTIADGVTVTLKGDLIASNSRVVVGAGVNVLIDASEAGGATIAADKFYVVDVAIQWGTENSKGRLDINGTEEAPSRIECIGGTSLFLSGHTMSGGHPKNTSGMLRAYWCKFKNFGFIPKEMAADITEWDSSLLKSKGYSWWTVARAWNPSGSGEGTNTYHDDAMMFIMDHCILDSTTGIQVPYAGDTNAAMTTWSFTYCRSTNTKYWTNNYTFIQLSQNTDVDDALQYAKGMKVPAVQPIRKMEYCSWDRYISFIDGAKGWAFEWNIFACGIDVYSDTSAPKSFRNNVILRSDVWGRSIAEPENVIPPAWQDGSMADHYGGGDIAVARTSFQTLPFGTGKRDPQLPADISAAGNIGSYIFGNYYIEDHARPNPHTMYLKGGDGNGIHILRDTIYEVDRTDGSGECCMMRSEFDVARTSPTHKTGALLLAGNLMLPSSSGGSPGSVLVTTATSYPYGHAQAGQPVLGGTYPDDTQVVGTGKHWGGHMPYYFTNNTFYLGAGEGAINTAEAGYSYDVIRYCKNNIFWDRETRTNQWGVGDVSMKLMPDLCQPENVDYNIKINVPHVPNTTWDGTTDVESIHSNGQYDFYNNKGYRGFELKDGEAMLNGVRRTNAYGLNDIELSIPDTSDLPIVNFNVGSGYYALSKVGVQSTSYTWQMLMKEFDWTDERRDPSFTRADLAHFVRASASPVVTTEEFNSALDLYQDYKDPLMTEGANPLGDHGHLPYLATDDMTKVLIAVNAQYPNVGALPFTTPNRPPIAGTDTFTMNQDSSIVITYDAMLANDYDLDASDTTLAIGSLTSPTSGTVATNSTLRQLTYTPNLGFFGGDSFTYQVSDARGGKSYGTVNLSVVNQAPIPQDFTVIGTSNEMLIIPRDDFLVGATDPDGNDANLAFDWAWTRTATKGDIQVSGSNVVYTPPSGFTGLDTFGFGVRDEVGQLASGTCSLIIKAGPGVVSVLTEEERTQLASVLSLGSFLALK